LPRTVSIASNAQRFDQIYENTSKEWRARSDRETSRKFLASVRKKLGDAGTWKVAGWNVSTTTRGTFVNIQCQSSFARGSVSEAFTWRVSGKEAVLNGWNVNIPLSIADQ